MTTQYTTILKLALPVQGELSGTWGDTVNDNITQMVEQAIAGKATIDSWTANAHTLTTADGTTSESRCAILELTDTGTALTGAGTVVCPTNTKLYIVDNNTAQIITVKTSGGTGVAVPVGKTMLVYCDGTNVVEGVTHANSLSLGTSTSTVNAIDTATDLGAGGSSNSNLPTQLAVKTYVDGQIAATNELSEVLAAGNVTGANDIDVENAQKVQFRDAAIYVNSSVDGQLDIVADGEVQIDTALVDINGNLDVSGTTNIGGSVSFTKNAIAGVAISTIVRASNTVTVTNSAVHGLTNGDLVNINGVANRSFNGYFTVAVSSTTVFTYSQTGADESSTGGTSTEIVYNLNASGTALNQMNGPLNIAANSGIDGLEITQSGSGEALSITGGNALFGDNDKAIFGIGNDLQIYHNGSNSFIDDAGTGNLQLRANAQIKLQKYTGENMFVGIADGAASMYYDNAQKIATTATGIQVTGDIVLGDTNPTITMNDSSVTDLQHLITSSSDRLIIAADNNDVSDGTKIEFYVDGTERMTIDSSGQVGIGTDSPGRLLELKESSTGAGDAIIRLRGNGNNADNTPLGSLEWFNADSSGAQPSVVAAVEAQSANSNGHMGKLLFKTHDGSGSEADPPTTRMVIDQSGNVGIGTSSPSSILHTNNTADVPNGITIQNSSASGSADSYVHFKTSSADVIMGIDATGTDVFKISNSTALGTSDVLTIDASGNVGIGTTTVNRKLEIAGNNNGGAKANYIRITDTDTSATADNQQGGIEFYTSDTTAGIAASIEVLYAGSGGGGEFTFNTAASSDAGVVEAMRIDESGNVGIGTDSPQSIVHIDQGASGDAQLTLETHAAGDSKIVFSQGQTAGNWAVGYDDGGGVTDNSLSFAYKADGYPSLSGQNLMILTPAGNVGIGTTSPTGLLHLSSSAPSFYMTDTTNNTEGVISMDNAGSLILNADLNNEAASSNIRFAVDGSEAMRISGDNVLVGKTSTGAATAGIELNGTNDVLRIARDGGVLQELNRITSDGDIIEFRKDNTTVGSIGVASGDNMYITSSATNHVGIYMGGGGILPMNSGALDSGDNVDLGSPNYQFADLYLSGGAYLGGTVAANKLDDYEEGTWTPAFTNGGGTPTYTASTTRGIYTKVGDLVTFSAVITTTALTQSSTGVRLTLPTITPLTDQANFCPVSVFIENGFNPSGGAGNVQGIVTSGTSEIQIYTIASSASTNYTAITFNDLQASNMTRIRFSGHYYV